MPTPSPLKETFESLVSTLGFTGKVRYTDERRRKLKKRLEGFTAEELHIAAKAIAADPYMQGDNPNKRRYGNIDYLLRNDEKVEQWVDTDNGGTTYDAGW
jgi:hypothetical protein